ncbi:Acetate kinase [Verrucomicrobia bacterium]|nr:Acetate kinase [Verrucomicrobiota bacterium]
MSTLAINAGSSSLKFGLFKDDTFERVLTGDIDWAGGNRQQAQLTVRPRDGIIVRSRLSVPDDATAAGCAIQAVVGATPAAGNGTMTITAVGHRVVHGGVEFRASVLIDEKVKGRIARLCSLAPLHNPPALRGIEAAEAALPAIPQVAVFDTAFYTRLPPKTSFYPVPYDWFQQWGVRRFGFHGISHGYCACRAAELLGQELGKLRLVSCHLGGGCSATAIQGGVAVATTGGFTPLEGLMMGTRCGSIDPGILLELQRQPGLTPKELDRALNHCSGLLGVSGVSADLAQIEVAAAQGNKRARLAFDMFAEEVRSSVGALATAMGGLDALIFTDRIGEQSTALRSAVCDGLQFIGLRLDPERNLKARPDADIAMKDSSARILVIHSQEELVLAQEARRVADQSAARLPMENACV